MKIQPRPTYPILCRSTLTIVIDTRVKRRNPLIANTSRWGGIGGCFAQVTLKVAHTPVGNLNFGQFSSTSWPKVVGGSVLVLAGIGYGSQYHRGMAPVGPSRLFSTLSRIIPVRVAKRVGGSTLTVPPPNVYPTSFCSIARNPMKFQCGPLPSPLLGYVLPRITPLDFGEGGARGVKVGGVINRPNWSCPNFFLILFFFFFPFPFPFLFFSPFFANEITEKNVYEKIDGRLLVVGWSCAKGVVPFVAKGRWKLR